MYDYPKETEDCFYLSYEITLPEILEEINRKWFGIDYSKITLTPVRIQTSGCGCHSDWSDYTDYICIERVKD